MTPHLHPGRRKMHVLGHMADGARLVFAQTWLTLAAHLFQYNAEAGFRFVMQAMDHFARTMKFGNVN
ncbi:hypothetical protein LP415_18730 [Polaromonas sp. P1(28)-8]|nr:hypothetical protein LP415_18730 [Polaromonas sp. P1(28)-8]